MTLRDALARYSRFQSYLYAYPHKTAYRPLPQPVDLQPLWQAESRQALFLYAHIPFCAMKCAFCNLFSLSHPASDQVDAYLATLARQARVTRDLLGDAHFAGYAIGGGTPSLLSAAQIDYLFTLLRDTLGLDSAGAPGSFELSPDTVTADKLAVLQAHGVERVSIGVQSFVDAEARAMGRQQPPALLDTVLRQIAEQRFAVFNLDLIYGIPGQTAASWQHSLQRALDYRPDELFLYPLYVRPLTGLSRKALPGTDLRDELYALGRDVLRAHGYVQDSLRRFHRSDAPARPSTEYSCQEDGMIGLGANARSYTRGLHYAGEYAVGKAAVADLIAHYITQPDAAFRQARHGIVLNQDERRRRYLIKSLLKVAGLDRTAYQRVFASDALADFPQLAELGELGLAEMGEASLRLTAEGLGYADLIGHWLISPAVRGEMEAYVAR